MSQRPLIGVTVGRAMTSKLPRLAINRAYVSALQGAGADVVLLPPVQDGEPPVPAALFDRLDGILLPGGADVSPERYGEHAREGIGEVDDDLDSLEIGLVRAAIDCGLPILGICRGLQVLNVALGGTLYQDLAREGLRTRRQRRRVTDGFNRDTATGGVHLSDLALGRDFLAHTIEVRAGTRLGELLGATRLSVNSLHHQAVHEVAPGLIVSAMSGVDDVIEGLESPDGRVMAIQCHPEELTGHAWARSLFRGFVAAASVVQVR